MFKSLSDKQMTVKISQNLIANQKGEIPVAKLLTGYLLNIRKRFRRNKRPKVSKFRKESTKLFKLPRANYFCISLQQEIDTVLKCSLASKYIALAIILLYLFAD